MTARTIPADRPCIVHVSSGNPASGASIDTAQRRLAAAHHGGHSRIDVPDDGHHHSWWPYLCRACNPQEYPQ